MVAEIHRELVQMNEEDCIDVSNVRRWKRDFENNLHVSPEDKWCSGQPADSLTVDNMCHVCEILETDDRFTLNEIVVCMLSVECGC